MKVSGIGLVILVCAIMLIPGVSAQDVDSQGGYVVTPAGDMVLPDVILPMSVDTITQGEMDWYSRYVSSGTASMTVDLNWGNAANSLSLTILA
ncbi:MAG: peptidase domain-containing protein, partial [Methanoregula sp.]